MKKVLFGTIIAATALVACKSGNNDQAVITDLNNTIDSLQAVNDSLYTAEKWSEIDSKINEKMMQIDTAKLDENGKAEYMKTKEKYNSYKMNYVTKIEEQHRNDSMKMAAAAMSNDAPKMEVGKVIFVNSPMKDPKDFSWVNGANCLTTYQNFYDVVNKKGDWTSEQLEYIKTYYEDLDTRKNEIEKDMPTGDNNKVAAVKLKFAPWFATHKISAK